METADDLVSVLNSIKHKEFDSIRYDFSEKMLKHFSSDKIAPKRYRTFHIKKKSGGLREIKAPCRQLDVILTCINIMLKSVYTSSDAAMGFTSGRSVLNNAQVHVGQNYVFNIDLKDFFPSISQARVWKRLQLPPFNFSQEIANIIAGLCCSYDETAKQNVLPQGSPASPLLTNAICDKLDRRMKGAAKRFGLHYSRYADDMTFSSMHNVYQPGSDFRAEIQRIISEQGFRMNETKTRLLKAGTRQEVTGLTVNAVANVSRKYISDLRWILHVWEKEGYAKAYALFYPKYKKDKGYIKKGEPIMENVIGGKLNYLKMVRGANNPAYKKLSARFEALQELIFVDSETDNTKSYVYVQSYTVPEFQSLLDTTIGLEVSEGKKVVGKCIINDRPINLSISRSTQGLFCQDLDSKSVGDPIHSEVLSHCFVTLCRDKGKNFWLITKFEPKRSHCLSIQNLKISPDDLLSLWEKEGFDSAAEELALFIQCGKPGESILDWGNFEKDDDERNPGRLLKYSGKEYLLKYFFNKRSLTSVQKNRLIKLLETNRPSLKNAEELLDIWENEGFDAAVKAWKRSHDGIGEGILIEKTGKKQPQAKASFTSGNKVLNGTDIPDKSDGHVNTEASYNISSKDVYYPTEDDIKNSTTILVIGRCKDQST